MRLFDIAIFIQIILDLTVGQSFEALDNSAESTIFFEVLGIEEFTETSSCRAS